MSVKLALLLFLLNFVIKGSVLRTCDRDSPCLGMKVVGVVLAVLLCLGLVQGKKNGKLVSHQDEYLLFFLSYNISEI